MPFVGSVGSKSRRTGKMIFLELVLRRPTYPTNEIESCGSHSRSGHRLIATVIHRIALGIFPIRYIISICSLELQIFFAVLDRAICMLNPPKTSRSTYPLLPLKVTLTSGYGFLAPVTNAWEFVTHRLLEVDIWNNDRRLEYDFVVVGANIGRV